MKACPLNPVRFMPGNPFDGDCQIFSVNDRILIEFFCDPEESIAQLRLIDGMTRMDIAELSWNKYVINKSISLYYYELMDLLPGKYILSIGGEAATGNIIVTDDIDVLNKTVLLQFRQRDNRCRNDVMTKIKGRNFFFDFRVPGGFKDEDCEFGVESDQFIDCYADIVEMYSSDITMSRLTVGHSDGVPSWVGEMVNKILSCDYVYIDGIRYNRDNGSVPEMEPVASNPDRFVVKTTLRKAKYLDAEFERENQLALRRVPDKLRSVNRGLRSVL